MKDLLRIACCVVCLSLSSHVMALYESKISLAQQWLSVQQNDDGSWGNVHTERFITTVEAVKALRAIGLRNDAYYRGITWLENHAGENTDYDARRAVALDTYGADVGARWLAELDNAQNTTLLGRNGWGVSTQYLESPLDTALALEGLDRIGNTSGSAFVSIQPALNYLKTSKRPNAGWVVGAQTSSDPFSTAIVVMGLSAWLPQDATLSAVIQGGVNHLQLAVNGSSPPALKALAAHAAIRAGYAAVANTWLSSLNSTQFPNGSWNFSVYHTALVLQAFAAADGLDTPAVQTRVSVPDANLRKAINIALGRRALDNLERGDLVKLTTLSARNVAISDLTGLEWATSLTHLDIRNNNITSIVPIAGLTQLTTLLLDGNPVAVGTDEDIPTLPEWGMILLACLIIWQAAKHQRRREENSNYLSA